jgi:hypothetical protein
MSEKAIAGRPKWAHLLVVGANMIATGDTTSNNSIFSDSEDLIHETSTHVPRWSPTVFSVKGRTVRRHEKHT